jgi:hypothetical protein
MNEPLSQWSAMNRDQPKTSLESAETTIFYRPVGPKEQELMAASGYREFPPGLSEQPIFYPVLNEEYARQIARDWNTPASGAGYVTRFSVRKEFAARYPVQTVGGSVHKELWIPAEDLVEMNRNVVGLIDRPQPLTDSLTH